jgi:sn-glycerol 3-phosphate transport system permease protein
VAPSHAGAHAAAAPAASAGQGSGKAEAKLRKRIRVGKYELREIGIAAAYLAPSLIVFALFFYWPFARLVGWGTYAPKDRGRAYVYEGVSRYGDVLRTDDFLSGLWLSTKFVLLTVPLGLFLGLLLAALAHRRLAGIRIFQTIFSSTIATSVAVAAIIFYVLINPTIGVLKVGWLDSPTWALPAVSLVTTWRNLGLAFVISLAGLQAIPEETLEAASLDGFGPVRRFFTIVVPQLWPVITFLVVVLSVSAFQEFAAIDIITSGTPAKSTELLVYKIFQRQNPQNITTGSVYAVGLFLITMVMAGLQFAVLNRRNRLD